MNARNVYIWIAHFIDTSRLEVATPSSYSESCWESLIKFVTRESSLTREPAVNTKNIPEKISQLIKSFEYSCRMKLKWYDINY